MKVDLTNADLTNAYLTGAILNGPKGALKAVDNTDWTDAELRWLARSTLARPISLASVICLLHRCIKVTATAHVHAQERPAKLPLLDSERDKSKDWDRYP